MATLPNTSSTWECGTVPKNLFGNYAKINGAIIITKDEDFPNRALMETAAPRIVWLRIGNCSRRALPGWFEPMLPDIESRIESGDTLIEIR